MKIHIQKTSGIISIALSLVLPFLAHNAAAQQGWDPNGTTSLGGSGFSWDTTNKYWTPNGTETQVAAASLVAWTAGDTALFCAGPSASVSQGIFTNAVNGTVSVGGIVLGNDLPGACSMTLNGPGTISLASASTPFVVGGTGGSSNIINCTIAGASGNVLSIQNSSSSITTLFGTNTYAGGTSIAGSGAINFNNGSSFGTGPITWAAGGFLQANGSSAINITNAMTFLANSIAVISGGNTGGLTFSGPWTLPSSGYGEIQNIAGAITVAGPIGGSVPFTVTNKGGTFTFTGTNTFTGSMTNAGTLTISGSGSLGSGNYAGTILDRTNLIFNTTTSQTLSGVISGSGGLTQQGNSTLTLNGANTYTNATILKNGILNVNSIGDSGSSAIGVGPVTLAGGTFLYTGGGDTTARLFTGTVATTTALDVPNGVTVTLTGQVKSTASWVVNMVDTGTLVLGGTADNAFLGMNVNAGTVVLSKTTAGHAIGNPLTVASNALVQFGNVGYNSEIANAITCPVTISGGGVLDANGDTQVFYSLSLSGAGSGTGALINSSGSPASLTSQVILATNTTIGGPGNITLGGTITGNVGTSLTYIGGAELSLAGASTYAGNIIVGPGLLDVSPTGSFPGSVTLITGGTLELDNNFALSAATILAVPASPAASIVNLNFTGTQVVSGLFIGSTPVAPGIYDAVTNNPSSIITGTGVLSVGQPYWDANGTDATHGTNTFGGGSGSWDNTSAKWWLSGNADTKWAQNNLANFAGTAGTVTLNANESASGLTFNTPGYDLTNTDGVSALTLNGPYPTITFPGGTTEIDCLLTGAGTSAGLIASGSGTLLLNGNLTIGGTNIGLTASGPGTVVLSGANTYTNGTAVTGGATLSVNSISDSGTSAIGNSGSVTLTGGTLSYTGAGATSTARAVTGSAGNLTNAINVPAGTLTLAGQVEGTNVSKTSSGTLILANTADNSGLNLAIKSGTVILNTTSSSTIHGLGSGASSVASGAQLQLAGSGGFDLFSSCILTISSGGILDVNSQSDSFSTLTLSGTGTGGGALINSSTIATSSLTNAGSGVVLAGATTIGGPGSITLASVVSGSGMSLTYSGSGTLKLSAANTYSGGLNVNPTFPGSVMLTSVTGGGTGPIAIGPNGTLDISIAGTTANAISSADGTAVVNISEPAGNTFITGSLSGFTGTINCLSATNNTGQIVINNANNAAHPISASAYWNVESGATLLFQTPYVTNAANVIVAGNGNSAVYGAFRLDACTQTGNVILGGDTKIGDDNTTAPSTISGVISDGGNGYGFTLVGTLPVTLQLTATNTYSGPTIISNGTLAISGAGLLGSGNYAASLSNNATFNYASSVAQTLSGVVSGTGLFTQSGPGTLTLTQTNIYTGGTLITNGSTLSIGGSGSLGATGTSNSYAGNVANYGTFGYASSAAQFLSGIISGTGALTDSGSGTLTLSGVDSYTGATSVKAGATLALASTGSINNTASINLAAGAILDVSAYALSYTFGGSTTLRPAGAGAGVGSTAATVKGSSGGAVNVGSLVLTFAPQAFSGDSTHPALYVSQGTLNLNGSGITVSNATATPLGAGTYSLIQVASGNITAANTNVTVTGTGLAPGATASLAVSGGSLNLVVASGAVPVPGINSIIHSGGNLIFSGTNGPANGTYYVLASTNAALHLSLWTPVATNTFSPTGTFSVTNAIGAGKSFFTIEIP